MARAVWTGSISFGLVSIPVRLFPATSPRDPRFHLVDRQTGRRIRYRRVVEEPAAEPAPSEPFREEPEPPESGPPEPVPSEPEAPTGTPSEPRPPVPTEREVSYSEVVRGYDVGEGRHVVVEPEELEALRPEPTRAIEIEHFVGIADVDPVHFEKSYHLGPADELAEKPYALLRVAMERTGRVGVGRFVLRSREHLALIRPTSGILGLETLYFEDEVRKPAEGWRRSIEAVEADLTDRELTMAERLIDALAADWEPAQYRDPYRERVLDLIRSRAPVEEPVAEEEAGSPSVVDLMAALRASVEAATETQGSKRRRKTGEGEGR
jgi:DNA end-binding protein Ku